MESKKQEIIFSVKEANLGKYWEVACEIIPN
jgi:hypothetical protein